MSAFTQWLAEKARDRESAGLVRATRVSSQTLTDLSSNDYLALRTHPAVIAGAVAAAQQFGAGAGSSRLVSGTLPIHERLEAALCSLTGAPAALVTSTGYHANLSALVALTDEDTLVVSDAHVHASLVDAARLAKAAVAISRHNDLAHVRELLAGRRHTRAVVVVESIYSVFGDAAPLAELAELVREFDALLLVDDAHGLGVCGGGRGGVASAGLSACDEVVTTVTLSKSLGAQGGAVLASEAVRDHLVNSARAFIYDTGLAPASAGAALAAAGIIEREPERVDRLAQVGSVIAAACEIELPAGAVMSVPMPSPLAALAAARDAADAQVRVGVFRPPSTPDGSSRLRLTAHAGLSDEQLAQAGSALRSIVLADALVAR